MTEHDVTMTMCAHCDQPVQPSLHTTVQCLDNMRQQRDEARAVAFGLLGHLQTTWENMKEAAESMDSYWKEINRAADRFYPWLKKTSKR